MKEKDKKKKDKAGKWHGPSRCLILNTASTNGQHPSDKIPESYQAMINMESVAMADKELHSQMVAKGHPEVGFAHGTAASLYNGSIRWQGRNKPSNLSFFTLYKSNPLSDSQTAHYLSLHILNNNTDNKNINEIKSSQKQQVNVPKDHHELIAVMEMYHSLTTILFGDKIALSVEVRHAITLLNSEISTIKVRIASDHTYPAKILYTIEIRIQRWLRHCEQNEDRSSIDNRIIDMDPVTEHILNSSLMIDLPPIFTDANPSHTKGTIAPTAAAGGQQQQGGENRGKKRKECNGTEAAKQYIKNENMIEEFKIKETENWKKDFASKNAKDRPKWNDKCWVCVRWFTKGDCFNECNNKDSHVGTNDVPVDKKAAYTKFLDRVRGRNSPN